ncbi:Hsp33 family molecular chaperone HslO [Inhella sp.]|uniref:Hsp33 family molecular chaperone HslO n=1 Tax=Inhella sp. TaxID=1921806 RepID=UPI0035B26A7A
MSDFQKFLFEGLPVRGMAVRLTDSWQLMQSRRDQPLPQEVMQLLGEMSACALLLQSTLKFDGALIMQMQGDGPVKLAVAEARTGVQYRATAKVMAEVPAGADLAQMLNLHGHGRCAITLDPRERSPGTQPYQGVVPLQAEDGQRFARLAQAVEQYMRLSEQLDTKLVLAANADTAAGLLIQRIPLEGEANLAAKLSPEQQEELADAFPRIAMKAATLTDAELLTLPLDTILHRLFWEEDLRRYDPAEPQFSCSCSRERVGRMLVNLGREEVDGIVAERGEVEIGCEFCGATYRFDAVDCTQLFTTDGGVQPAHGSLQ